MAQKTIAAIQIPLWSDLCLAYSCFPQFEYPNAWHIIDSLKILMARKGEREEKRKGGGKKGGRGKASFSLPACWLNMVAKYV